MRVLDLPWENLREHRLFDDFYEFVSGDVFTDTSGDTGASVAGSDAAGGVAALVTGATDNNEAYLHSTNETFLFADAKPLEAVCRIQWAEANTDDANVAFGLANAVGADMLVDDGAGPKSSYSGAVIYKVDGGTVWICESSISTTQTTTTSTVTTPNAAGDWHSLRILAVPTTSTNIRVTFFVDEAGGTDFAQMKDANGNLIQHDIALGTPTEMELFVGAKAGGANSETINVDYLGCRQVR